MQDIEVCFIEPDAPSQLITWAKEARSHGGIAVPDVTTAIEKLNEYEQSIVWLAQNNRLVGYGAWLCLCVADWVEILLRDYQVGSLHVDLARSFTGKEAMDMEPVVVMTIGQRYDFLHEYRPNLVKNYHHSLSPDGLLSFTQKTK